MESEARGERSLGGVIVPVLVGALLLLAGLALQTGLRVQNERVDRVVNQARSLAAVASEVISRPGGGKDQLARAGDALKQGDGAVLAYAVVKEEGGAQGAGGLGGLLGGGSEGGSGALAGLFASLAGKEILAHSDPDRVGSKLAGEEIGDVDPLPQAWLFREANSVKDHLAKNVEARAADPTLEADPYREVSIELRDDESVVVMAPVLRDGKLVATATVLAKPGRVEPGRAWIWVVVSALVILGLGFGLKASSPGLPVLSLLFLLPAFVLTSQSYDVATSRLVASQSQSGALASAIWKAGADAPLERLQASLNRDSFGSARDLFEVKGQTLEARVEVLVSTGLKRLWPAAVTALAVLGLVGLFVTGRAQRAFDTFVKHWFAYAYIAPTMAGMLLLVFGPFTYGLGLAFFARVYGDFHFVGLHNFFEILGNISLGSGFYTTFGVTVLWTVVNVVLHVSIGLGLALLLKDKSLGGTAAYRALLIVPWAVPNYITALIWKGLFNKEFGAINAFLGVFGVEPISWFDTFWKAFFANVATNTWLGFPFMMVVSLGALQSIPQDLYEAADVDGAGRWAKFRYITLPLLKPALFPAVILGIIWTFNMFNVIYLVSGGAPDGKTDILITEAYRWAFERGRYGYAAAYSTIIFGILLSYTLITNRLTRATEGAYE